MRPDSFGFMPQSLEASIKEAVKKIVKEASIGPALDVKDALRKSLNIEVKEASRNQLNAILRNVELAQSSEAAVCQDTGLPNFFVRLGDDFPVRSKLIDILGNAVSEVTAEVPLRPNTVDPIEEHNPGNNTGIHIPWLDIELVPGDFAEITYVPKGGGTELPSRGFVIPPGNAWGKLPKLVLDAVVEAGPIPCPPVIVGVGIGGTVEMATKLAKRAATLRPVGSRNSNAKVAELEDELLKAINKLGIGPHGTGGAVTALDVHVEYGYRHPATFAIGIVFSCWATRRSTVLIHGDGKYEFLPHPRWF